jgi:hypothetical protein
VQLRLLRQRVVMTAQTRHRRMCSCTAFTTHYRGGTPRRRGATRKTSSTAQPRQGRGLTATSMRITALLFASFRRRGPPGSLEPGALPRWGGGGGCARALAVSCGGFARAYGLEADRRPGRKRRPTERERRRRQRQTRRDYTQDDGAETPSDHQQPQAPGAATRALQGPAPAPPRPKPTSMRAPRAAALRSSSCIAVGKKGGKPLPKTTKKKRKKRLTRIKKERRGICWRSFPSSLALLRAAP